MTEFATAVPSINIPSVYSAPNESVAPSEFTYLNERGRRSFLKLIAAGVTTLVAWSLDLIPGLTSEARAYSQWSNCSPQNYYAAGAVCYPASASISGSYCTSSGWFKSGYFWISGTKYHGTPILACAGRNAWNWYLGYGVTTKCADGNYYIIYGNDWYGPYFGICRKHFG